MSKKHNCLFPALALLTPPLIFAIVLLLNYIKGGELSFNAYSMHFKLYWQTIKLYNAYIFPLILYFSLSATTMLLHNLFFKKYLSVSFWVVFTILGIVLMLFGSRFLFFFTHTSDNSELFSFLLSGINIYSFTLALQLTFFINAFIKALEAYTN